MKRILILLLFVLICYFSTIAQRPKWTSNPPRSGNTTYIYRVEYGTGATEKEARNNAFLRILQSAANSMGVAFDSKAVNDAILDSKSMQTISLENNIPVNKVCEYPEKISGEYRVYLLCQVAKSGNVIPVYDEFRACDKIGSNTSSLWRSAIIPGWGQFHVKDNKMGAIFMGSEALLIGAAIYTSSKSSNYMDKADQSFDYKTKKYYIEKSDDWKTYRNVIGAGVLAVWAINIVHAATSDKKNLAFIGKNRVELFTAQNQIGLKFNIN